MADTAPDTLLCNGETNPSDVAASPAPYFSAIYRSLYGMSAEEYQIQVDTDSEFGSPIWDSEWTALGSLCPFDTRCENVNYGGSTLIEDGTKYYWRIRFRAWSD